MRFLFIDNYKTYLGLVALKIESNVESIITQQHALTTINTWNHKIEIFSFENIREWLKNTDHTVEQSKGWMIKTTKLSHAEKEVLKFYCELSMIDSSTDISHHSGENLDAVWIENQTHCLNIGTEDNEMIKYRASINDLMPKRLENEPKQDFLFTKYTEKGFCTEVPNLKKGEQIYFHYLIAADTKRKSRNYPDEDDISTWFAVDYSKQTLVERLNLSNWNNKI